MSNTDGAAPAAVPSSGELSINEAVGILNQPPEKRKDEPATPPREEPRAAREKSTPTGVDAEPPDASTEAQQAPGEEPEVEDEAEEPPVAPPRTWTKAEKEAFALLPREHQQSIVDRESERDSYYQRGLREAAERSRAAQAAQQAAEQRQREYEAVLPQAYASLYDRVTQEFSDIKSQADVDALRVNDPMRWMALKDAREALQNKWNETQAAGQRQQQEYWQRFAQWTEGEDTKAEEYLRKEHPKLDVDPKDPKAISSIEVVGKGLKQMLINDVGFTDEEVTGWWAGQPMSLRDSRVQRVFIDHYAYRKAKAAAKEIPAKPVPPVQRPGTASNRGEATNVTLKILSDRLSKTGKFEDAWAYQNAKSEAQARRRG